MVVCSVFSALVSIASWDFMQNVQHRFTWLFSLSSFHFHYLACIIAVVSPILYSLYAYLYLRQMGQIYLCSSDNSTKSTSFQVLLSPKWLNLIHSGVDVKHTCIYFCSFPIYTCLNEGTQLLNGFGCTLYMVYCPNNWTVCKLCTSFVVWHAKYVSFDL